MHLSAPAATTQRSAAARRPVERSQSDEQGGDAPQEEHDEVEPLDPRARLRLSGVSKASLTGKIFGCSSIRTGHSWVRKKLPDRKKSASTERASAAAPCRMVSRLT